MFLLGIDVGTGSLVKFVSVDTCSYIIIVFFPLTYNISFILFAHMHSNEFCTR